MAAAASQLEKPRLSLWQIWNMSFGFLGIQFGYWAGVYNAVCFIVSPLLPLLARRIGRRGTHSLCLLAGAAGLLSIALIHNKWLPFYPCSVSVLHGPAFSFGEQEPSCKFVIVTGRPHSNGKALGDPRILEPIADAHFERLFVCYMNDNSLGASVVYALTSKRRTSKSSASIMPKRPVKALAIHPLSLPHEPAA